MLKPILALLFVGLAVLAQPKKPNFVIFFTDDMGYRYIGPFGGKIPTPNLDRMAKEGVKLNDFYVSSCACTPSRSALMTGCYADRIEMGKSVVFPGDERGLNPKETTIAELLKTKGYVTGCFGKWHLGDQPEFMPLRQGFDEFEGIPYSNDMWAGKKGKDGKPKWGELPYIKGNKAIAHVPDSLSQALLTDATANATVDFINRHKDEPFFVYVPFSATHNPTFVLKERGEKMAALGLVKNTPKAAQVGEVDDCVGRVMAALRKHGIAEKTLVFFTNDNGGGHMEVKPGMIPLRGGKFGPKYEGHMRMCTLAWWPGVIAPGTENNEIMASIDILPTLAALAGAEVPTTLPIDGHNVADVLLGKPGAKSPHDYLYYETDGIRQGKWKMVQVSKKVKVNGKMKKVTTYELYDLDKDLGETTNIADRHPEKIEALKKALTAHVERIRKGFRPAGKCASPRRILAPGHGLPNLAELMGKTKEEVYKKSKR